MNKGSLQSCWGTVRRQDANACSGGTCFWLHGVWQTRGLDKAWGEEGAGLGVTSRPAACTRAEPGEAGRHGHMWGNDLHWRFLLNFFRRNYWTDLTVLCIQTDTDGGQRPTGLFFFSDSSPHSLLKLPATRLWRFSSPEGHPSSLAVHPEGSQLGRRAQTRLGGSGVDLAVGAAPGWVRTLLLNTWGTQRVCHQSHLSL